MTEDRISSQGSGRQSVAAPPDGSDQSSQDPTLNKADEPINYGAYARAIVTARARIGRHLDASLFADPALDILLDLLASEEEGRKVNMTGCACASRVARTTALRWICLLERKGLIERTCDKLDQRTTIVRLTSNARTSLIDYLRQVARVPMLR